MIVVDATAWVNYLTGALDDVDARRLRSPGAVIGPTHVDFEVGSALVRNEKRGLLTAASARDLAEAFALVPFERVRDTEDLVTAFDLLNNATYADAIYVAMAKRLNCPVMTSDSGMIECARIAKVEVIDVTHEAMER